MPHYCTVAFTDTLMAMDQPCVVVNGSGAASSGLAAEK
jgi:hypothetical protein